MNNEELLIKSGEWVINEATKLIAQYNDAKTQYAKRQLLPKLKSIHAKLKFEFEQLDKIINE